MQMPVFDNLGNVTEWVNVTTRLRFMLTDLRYDANYAFYYVHLSRMFITGIIPVSSLIYLNWGIHK